jgi:ribulose bisphosphate carboxylase small subunit
MSYYLPPKFLDRLSVHITKNFLNLPNVRVPLILGIHGRKGEGKTFMCELVFKRMGIGVVYMSAGELESPDAGDPARLIRLRYREAGEWSRVHGRMAVLMINDVDAGIGRVDSSTQYTVNTQLVNATLMNIADHPTNVQLPGSYDADPTTRIPIILTGNDFSTLYAPLIRDGRMEKFFWDPTHEERIGIVNGIFSDDDVPKGDVQRLVDEFPEQSTDFFSAMRSRLFDEQVRQLIQDIGIEKVSQKVVHSDGSPVEFRKPNFSLSHLIEIGNDMVREQDRIRELRLSQEYNEVLRTISQASQEPPAPTPAGRAQASSGEYFTYYGSTSDIPSYPSPNGHSSSTELPEALSQEARKILNQGLRLGIEYVDERRFRTGSWQCFGMYQGSTEEAIAALSNCLTQHPNHYIRLVGIDGDRRRNQELIVHRPGSKVG